MDLEKFVKQHGFDSIVQFNRLVASVDLRIPEQRIAFKTWQENDGSKEGLLKLKMIKEES